MPILSTGSSLTSGSPQAPGSILTTAAKIRMSGEKWTRDIAGEVANMGHQLQDQVNKIYVLISQPQPALAELVIVNSMGSLIGWIGDRVVNQLTYLGAWFTRLYIGGTSAADAPVVISDSGISVAGVIIISPTGDVTFHNVAMSGNFTGTHAQNVGTGDSPTFSNVSGGGTSLALLLSGLTTTNSNVATLAAQVATLNGGLFSLAATVATISANYVSHGAGVTGTANLTTGAVTGSVT